MKQIYYIFCISLALTRYLEGQQVMPLYRMTSDTVALKEITVSYTIPLDNKQIQKFYSTNYFSTIDNLAGHLDGVSLVKRGAYAMEPQLNGFSGGQLNITIDGMKIFGACTDKMDPVTSYLEPVNLKAITLSYGTNSSLHGNNIGGSIDLSLSDPAFDKNHPIKLSSTFGYESASNSRNILLSAGYSKNRWAWILNGVYRKNDDYRAGGGEKINYSQFEKFNTHFALKFLPKISSSFRADLLWDLARDVGYPALPMDVSRARAALSSIEYQKHGSKYNIRARVYYNTVYHLMDDSARDSLFFLYNKTSGTIDSVIMRMDMPGWSSTFGSYFQAEVDLNSKNRLTIKADNYINSSLAEMVMHMHFTGQPMEPPMYLQTWPDLRRNVTGIYLANNTDFSRKLSLTVNLRLDYNHDNLLSPVASEQFSVFNYKLPRKSGQLTKGINLIVNYRLFKPVILSLQTGFSERMPTISERYGFYLYNAYDGYDYIGNPYLKTEKALSTRFTLTYFNNGLKINFSQSLSFMNDYITGKTDTVIPPMNFYTNGLRVYQNFQDVRLYSTDIQIMYKPSGGFSLFNLSKYTYGQFDPLTPLPLIPPFKNTFTVCFEKRGWSFQAENETALRQKRINEDYGEGVSASFTLFNFRAGYHLMLNGPMLDFGAGITNIFDNYYHEHLDWGDIPRPGRSFNFMIKLTY